MGHEEIRIPVNLSELSEEEISSKQAPIKPFLTKDQERSHGYFTGEPRYPDEVIKNDPHYLYHTTTLSSFADIIRSQGLKSQKGGTGGAGSILASGAMQKNFNKKSEGFIHAADTSSIVTSYAHEYDRRADDVDLRSKKPSETGDLTKIPVILRFRREYAEKPRDEQTDKHVFENDPCHPGAVRFNNDIDIEHIEFLTHDGWQSLAQEIDRKNVLDEINEILPPKTAADSKQASVDGSERQTPKSPHTPTPQPKPPTPKSPSKGPSLGK